MKTVRKNFFYFILFLSYEVVIVGAKYCILFGRCRGLELPELGGRQPPRLELRPQLWVEAEDVVEAVPEERYLPEDEVESPHLSHILDRLQSKFPWAMRPQHRRIGLIGC